MRRLISLFILLFLSQSLWAVSSASKYLQQLKNAKSNEEITEAYIGLIRHYALKNPDSVSYYSNAGIAWCKKQAYRLGEGKIIVQLALIDNEQGRPSIAEQRFMYALEIYKEYNFKSGIADLLGNLGALKAGKGDFDAGLKDIFASLKLNEALDNNSGLMVAYMNVGSIYLQQGDTTNATKYLDLAELVSKKTAIVDKTIALYNMIGISYAMKGNNKKALEYLLRNLKLSEKPEFTNSHVECLLYLGNFFHDQHDISKAMQYLQEGLKIATERDLPEIKSNILVEIATMTREVDPQSAINYLKKAEAISRSLDNRNFLIAIYGEMAGVYKQQGKFQEALLATEQKQKIADSLFSINKLKEMTSIAATYELERSALQVKEYQALSKRHTTQRNMVVIIAICIALVLTVLYIFYNKTTRLNKQLKTHEEELKELNSTKDKFFSIIGHDLRSPIARVPVILDLLEDKNTSEEEKKYLLDSMREHSKVSMEMLDKLLFWGQSLVKGIRIQQQNILLNEYIKENIALKNLAAEEKHIEIIDRVPEDLQVYADPTHCDFIVRNLLANAIKYTYEHGRIEINADSSSHPGFTVFSIKDNGMGIDPVLLPGIFSPLYSIDGTAQEKGTGIGLMLCKEFAIQNGGDIWVESEPGKGATFYLSLKNAT